VCRSTEYPRRPTSVIGLVADAGEPKSTEDSLRCCAGDPLEGSWTVPTERRCCSTRPHEGPDSGRSSRLAELHSIGVDGSTDDPGDATVLNAVNMPRRQSKLRDVSSCGAWGAGYVHVAVVPPSIVENVVDGMLHHRRRATGVEESNRRWQRHCLVRDPLWERLITYQGRGTGLWRDRWR